jgi:trimethylamine:corrinoid methyltransferase-like protein
MALDVIEQVGHFKEYISTRHTLKNFRGLSSPALIDRERRNSWERKGGLSMYEKAEEKARELLRARPADVPSESVCREMDAIIKEAESELAPKK